MSAFLEVRSTLLSTLSPSCTALLHSHRNSACPLRRVLPFRLLTRAINGRAIGSPQNRKIGSTKADFVIHGYPRRVFPPVDSFFAYLAVTLIHPALVENPWFVDHRGNSWRMRRWTTRVRMAMCTKRSSVHRNQRRCQQPPQCFSNNRITMQVVITHRVIRLIH